MIIIIFTYSSVCGRPFPCHFPHIFIDLSYLFRDFLLTILNPSSRYVWIISWVSIYCTDGTSVVIIQNTRVVSIGSRLYTMHIYTFLCYIILSCAVAFPYIVACLTIHMGYDYFEMVCTFEIISLQTLISNKNNVFSYVPALGYYILNALVFLIILFIIGACQIAVKLMWY